MPDYRRAWQPGGACFFTVNLLQRHGNGLLTRRIDLLRDTVGSVRQRHPFKIHGLVQRGVYPKDWAGAEEALLAYAD